MFGLNIFISHSFTINIFIDTIQIIGLERKHKYLFSPHVCFILVLILISTFLR